MEEEGERGRLKEKEGEVDREKEGEVDRDKEGER